MLLAVIYLSFEATNAAGYDFDKELYKGLFICSGLGIAGGVIVKKRNVLSGVLMLVGAVV